MKNVRNVILACGLILTFVLSACGSPTPVVVVVTATPLPPTDAPVVPTTAPTQPLAPVALAGPQSGSTMTWVDGSTLVYVPPSVFTMGNDGFDAPVHEVTLDGYWIQQTKVTNRMFAQCVAVGACSTPAQELGGLVYSNPDFANHPVVGVTWDQATQYCKWRTDRVNELILIQRGYLKKNPFQVSEDNFNTRTYVAGQYEGLAGIKKKDIDPTGTKKRNIRYEDGILTADYRLPTEAEWEYAALAYKGRNPEPDSKRRRGEEVVTDRQVYPWGDNLSTREGMRNAYQGMQLANFKRGLGDQMGVAGGLNDNADRPSEIYSYKPNAFGLYNMAGNVSEWVMDVYRPNTPQDADDRIPLHRNVFDQQNTLEDNTLDE